MNPSRLNINAESVLRGGRFRAAGTFLWTMDEVCVWELKLSG